MDEFLGMLANGKIIIVFAWFGFLLLMESCFPAASAPLDLAGYRKAWWQRWGRNVGLAGISALVSRFFVLPITVFASLHPLWQRGDFSLPVFLLDILLLDLWIYWWHRANHELPFLWRFHQIHHRDRFLDTTSAMRFHFGEVLLSAIVRSVAIVALAIPLRTLLVYETIVVVCALFHHSNWRLWPQVEGILSRVIITPSLHWVHHHAVQQDTDSTYGTLFSFWDRLFRTSSNTRRTPLMPIGVIGQKELPLLELLKKPVL